MVCVIHDIDDRKRREIESARKQELDPATTAYRFEPGMGVIAAARAGAAAGQLAAIEIDGFASIVRDYGIPFGDVLLNELTKVTRAFNLDKGNHDAILVRAGAGQFVCWVPGKHADDVVSEVAELQRRFAKLVRRECWNWGFTRASPRQAALGARTSCFAERERRFKRRWAIVRFALAGSRQWMTHTGRSRSTPYPLSAMSRT